VAGDIIHDPWLGNIGAVFCDAVVAENPASCTHEAHTVWRGWNLVFILQAANLVFDFLVTELVYRRFNSGAQLIAPRGASAQQLLIVHFTRFEFCIRTWK
jgi:hypothetical protein